jgi:hypothetical protein
MIEEVMDEEMEAFVEMVVDKMLEIATIDTALEVVAILTDRLNARKNANTEE